MAPLGEHFPPALKRKFVEEKLKPGAVVRLEVKFPQVTKPKFLVLVADDEPDFWTFIVNSEISQFVANRPNILKCQVGIDAENHPFLDHNSHVSCHEVLKLKREDVIKKLVTAPAEIKGDISADVRSEILAAVKFAETLSKSEKDRIITCLSS